MVGAYLLSWRKQSRNRKLRGTDKKGVKKVIGEIKKVRKETVERVERCNDKLKEQKEGKGTELVEWINDMLKGRKG